MNWYGKDLHAGRALTWLCAVGNVQQAQAVDGGDGHRVVRMVERQLQTKGGRSGTGRRGGYNGAQAPTNRWHRAALPLRAHDYTAAVLHCPSCCGRCYCCCGDKSMSAAGHHVVG